MLNHAALHHRDANISADNLRQTNVKLQSEKIIYVRAWDKEKRRRNKDEAYLKHRTDMNHPLLYKSTTRSIFTLCRALLLKCTLRWDGGASERLHAADLSNMQHWASFIRTIHDGTVEYHREAFPRMYFYSLIELHKLFLTILYWLTESLNIFLICRDI